MNVQSKLLAALVAVAFATPVPMVMAAPGQVTNTVNVRSGPSFHNGVIGQLPGGQVVDVAGCQNGWCLVALGGTPGWIKARIMLNPPAGAGAPAVAAPPVATAYAGAAPLAPYGRAVAFAGARGYYGVGRGYYGVGRGYHPVARAAARGFHGVGPHQYYIGGYGYYGKGHSLSYSG